MAVSGVGPSHTCFVDRQHLTQDESRTLTQLQNTTVREEETGQNLPLLIDSSSWEAIRTVAMVVLNARRLTLLKKSRNAVQKY